MIEQTPLLFDMFSVIRLQRPLLNVTHHVVDTDADEDEGEDLRQRGERNACDGDAHRNERQNVIVDHQAYYGPSFAEAGENK